MAQCLLAKRRRAFSFSFCFVSSRLSLWRADTALGPARTVRVQKLPKSSGL